MKFAKHFPTKRLQPYIKYFVVSENELEQKYNVYPYPGLVIGFQYKGQLSTISGKIEKRLSASGITGISDSFKTFKNSVDIGTVLVYFTETGFAHFSAHPANELFRLSLSLDDIFDKNKIEEIEEKLAFAHTDTCRIKIVEQFLISQLKEIDKDRLITEAVRLIYQSKGAIRIRDLNEKLFISQSPLEKRFRKVVGTSAKKFASIVRFNTVIDSLADSKTLTEICYEHNFFDQSHFIRDFKRFTGETPENLKRFL